MHVCTYRRMYVRMYVCVYGMHRRVERSVCNPWPESVDLFSSEILKELVHFKLVIFSPSASSEAVVVQSLKAAFVEAAPFS